MSASTMSPSHGDDVDALLLDWSFLKIPLELLSTSVRQMHKTLETDAARLTGFLAKQFSASPSVQQKQQHSCSDVAVTDTHSFEKETQSLRQSSVLPQCCSTFSNGGSSSGECQPINRASSSIQQHDSLSNVSHRIFPSYSSISDKDAECRIAELEELEKRFKETLRAVEKVSEFVERMKNRTQTHMKEIDAYARRCEGRIQSIMDQEKWPSPQTITRLSMGPSFESTPLILLNRRVTTSDVVHGDGSKTNVNVMASLDASSPGSALFSLMTQRVDVMVYHYLSRIGFMRTAEHLRRRHDLENLVDREVYESVASITEALRHHDTAPALAWCAAHRSKLRKLQNTLEIQLRLQETTSMILNGNSHDALIYLRNNVAPDDAANCLNIRPVLSLLAFVNSTGTRIITSSAFPSTHKFLVDPSRWNELIDLFKGTVNLVYDLCSRSQLEVLIQCGCSALITKSCSLSVSPSCPCCNPVLWDSNFHIPSTHHIRSYIVCPIKGHIMGDVDPPLVSPDGLVFSTSAVHELASTSNDGTIAGPYTDTKYTIDRFHRLYIT